MKKLTLFLLLIAAIVACDKSELFIEPDQDISEAIIEVADADGLDEVFAVVQEQPTYPGGNEAWQKYLSRTLNYPEKAKTQGIEGAVFVSFVVDKTGDLRDMQVIRGIGAGCDEEALRVLLESEKWNPGKQRGREVSARMQMRIVFRLSEGSSGPKIITHETSPLIVETPNDQDPEVYMTPEESPKYEGGTTGWANYLDNNMNYPTLAKSKGIEGSVYVSFVVDKSGVPNDIQVIRGIGAGCDEEVVRLIKNSEWIPAKHNGEVVKARTQMRVTFKI